MGAGVGVKGEVRYLDERQAKGSLKMNDSSQDRPWGLWVKEVEACPLYKREGVEQKPDSVLLADGYREML